MLTPALPPPPLCVGCAEGVPGCTPEFLAYRILYQVTLPGLTTLVQPVPPGVGSRS